MEVVATSGGGKGGDAAPRQTGKDRRKGCLGHARTRSDLGSYIGTSDAIA